MQGKIQERADIGIVTFMAYPIIKGEGPILESLEALASDDYFSVLEVTRIKDEATRKKAQALVAKHGKSVAFGSQPTLLINKLNLNDPDEVKRQAAIDAVKKDVDEAYDWKARGLGVLSGVDPGPDTRQEAKALLVDSLKQICAYSASKGEMPVVIEAFDRVEFGKNCLIGPTDDAVEVAAAVTKEFPSFGLMLDLSHLPLLGETPQQSLGGAREYLRHAHIGNCVMRHPEHEAYGDNHPPFGIQEGENDLPELVEFLKVLNDIGYLDGSHRVLSFEVKPCTGDTAGGVIAASKKLLDEAWRQVE